MIIAVVGSGGKTTLIKKLAAEYRSAGKKVFVTTTTHMLIEQDTLLTDDADWIIRQLQQTGYVMAGIPHERRINPLSQATFEAVCSQADVVLVEADGSKRLPLKYPNATEPVIPANTEEIIVVCGLNGIGQQAKDVCHRLELVKDCLGIQDDTEITSAHVLKLVTEGYLKPLRAALPGARIMLKPRHNGNLYQRAIASLLESGRDGAMIRREWFTPQPRLFLCGAGHVAREVAALAAHLDLPVTVMDERPELANSQRFPGAEQIICDSFDHLQDHLEPDACYVVVTPNHRADLQCVRTILPSAYRYLGMIGSRGKVAQVMETLRNEGFSEEKLQTIFAPIGLPIGAETPAEIAFSILGQIIQVKNQYSTATVDRSLLETQEPGVLCLILEKHGSAPRGAGSMMFVGAEKVLGTIGGGEPEYLAIQHAREITGYDEQEYRLDMTDDKGLDAICGGSVRVAFIPV